MENKAKTLSVTVTRHEAEEVDIDFPKFDNFIASVLDCAVAEVKNYQFYNDALCIGVFSALDDYPYAHSVTLVYDKPTDTIYPIVNRLTTKTMYDPLPVIHEQIQTQI